MKKIILGIICFATVATISNCKKKSFLESDPEFSLAHGVLIGPEGVFRPDINYLLDIQNGFIKKYKDSLNVSALNQLETIEKNIYAKVSDKFLANALYLDWIVDNLNSKKPSTLGVANNSLRWYYVKNIQNDPILPSGGENWTKGIETKIALELEELGLKVFWEVQNGTPKYIEDCLQNGVPVPDKFFGENWEPLGVLNADEKIIPDGPRELNMYLSTDPPGFCISLTITKGGGIEAINLICFGTQDNNACFFENINVPVGSDIDILDLEGADQLRGMKNCIKCHIGENPFIVHPKALAFAEAYKLKDQFFGDGANLNGNAIENFTVVGDTDWPPNPPPFENLNVIGSKEKCTRCHYSSYAGRFPDLSQVDISDFEAYCKIIFPATIGEPYVYIGGSPVPEGFEATMPFEDIENIHNYLDQIKKIKESCGNPPDKGEIVDNIYTDDPRVTSPPRIIERIVQCSEAIFVEGFLEKATLTLFINNLEVEGREITNEEQTVKFVNFDKLNIGDKIHVEQTKIGIEPTKSMPVYVLDIYELGSPQPVISPEVVYECADAIAVICDIPGLPIEITINGVSPYRTHTYAGHQVIYPNGAPFSIGDEFTARIIACDEESQLSNKVYVLKAPENIEDGVVNPETFFVGQKIINISNLTYGSKSTLIKQNSEIIYSGPSWPLNTKNVYLDNPISLNDQAFVFQKICEIISGTSRRLINPKSCDELPAANIEDPRPGDRYIFVYDLIPGSRTIIKDSDGIELGDSNLGAVELTRDLEDGEVITAFLQIGECGSLLAIQFTV